MDWNFPLPVILIINRTLDVGELNDSSSEILASNVGELNVKGLMKKMCARRLIFSMLMLSGLPS
jgi:hypothetical protein